MPHQEQNSESTIVAPKLLSPMENALCSLEVFECGSCGFHLGLDATYLEQVDEITMPCPSCGKTIETDLAEQITWTHEPPVPGQPSHEELRQQKLLHQER